MLFSIDALLALQQMNARKLLYHQQKVVTTHQSTLYMMGCELAAAAAVVAGEVAI